MQVHAAGGILTWQLLVGSYADGLQIRPSAVTALHPELPQLSKHFQIIMSSQVKSSGTRSWHEQNRGRS